MNTPTHTHKHYLIANLSFRSWSKCIQMEDDEANMFKVMVDCLKSKSFRQTKIFVRFSELRHSLGCGERKRLKDGSSQFMR